MLAYFHANEDSEVNDRGRNARYRAARRRVVRQECTRNRHHSSRVRSGQRSHAARGCKGRYFPAYSLYRGGSGHPSRSHRCEYFASQAQGRAWRRIPYKGQVSRGVSYLRQASRFLTYSDGLSRQDHTERTICRLSTASARHVDHAGGRLIAKRDHQVYRRRRYAYGRHCVGCVVAYATGCFFNGGGYGYDDCNSRPRQDIGESSRQSRSAKGRGAFLSFFLLRLNGDGLSARACRVQGGSFERCDRGAGGGDRRGSQVDSCYGIVLVASVMRAGGRDKRRDGSSRNRHALQIGVIVGICT